MPDLLFLTNISNKHESVITVKYHLLGTCKIACEIRANIQKVLNLPSLVH
jgi:hypothetical protein